MHSVKCPICKKDLVVDSNDQDDVHLYCPECGYLYVSKEKRVEKAYLRLLVNYDKKGDKIKEEFNPKNGETIVRSLDEIRQKVGSYGLVFDRLNNTVLGLLKDRKSYLVEYRFIREQIPEEGPNISSVLGKNYGNWIEENFFRKFFKFQADAVKKILEGKDIVLVAPTGSGKTEAFAIPAFVRASAEANRVGPLSIGRQKTFVLFVYPTKALARDQKIRLGKLAEGLGLTVGVFDGDTKKDDREKLYDYPPDALITNFDILHIHLALNTKYSRLFKTARMLVVDEVHNYVGSFGSHIHYIIKRLERFTGRLQVVASSATVYNPREFCEELFSRRFEVVEESEGKHGQTHFLMMYPSIVHGRVLRVNAIKQMIQDKYKVLSFSNSHSDAELLLRYARKERVNVEIHRAGLTKEFRENVESRFKEGKVDAIIATPTLELGIDIGHVDAIVSDLVNVTKLVQRAGRAGRRGQESIILLVLRNDDPISGYYKNHPDDYFADVSGCYVDPFNPIVKEKQTLSAICDKPLRVGEELYDQKTVDSLLTVEEVTKIRDRVYATKKGKKEALKANIRGSGGTIEIFCNGKNIGFREVAVGIGELHPNAIYMHGGENYLSKELKKVGEKWIADIEKLPRDHPYYTKPLKTVIPDVIKVNWTKEVYGLEIAFCDIKIKMMIYGYVLSKFGEEKKGEQMLLEQPVEYEYDTKGFVFRSPVPTKIIEKKQMENVIDKEEVLASSFHATEHVVIEGSNMITGGGANDMGGVSMGTTGMIFIYDGTEGGNGASKLLYDRLEEAFKRGKKILEECPCKSESGCPRCTYSYHCGNNNKMLNKYGALEVFDKILLREREKPDFSLYGKTIV